MKLSPKTLQLLKNFSTINQSIVLKSGGVLATINSAKSVMARAKIEEEFDGEYGIYALPRFLGVLSLFSEPELDFEENKVVISSGSKKVSYHYSDTSNFNVPPDKDIKLPSVDAKFEVSSKEIQNALKALGVLGLTDVAFVADGSEILLTVLDVNGASSDAYSVKVGNTDSTFKAVFKTDNLKLIDGEYEVSICKKGISMFRNESITYWIAVEDTSTF